MQEQQQIIQTKYRKMIQFIAVVDIDPSFQSFKPLIEQKYITNLQFSSQPYKQHHLIKTLFISKGLYLIITYAQQNQQPIYQIDFISQQTNPQWIPLRFPQSTANMIDATLCYKKQETQYSSPLADIDILSIERKSRFGQSKQVINVPHGYHMLNTPIANSFLIYKKVRNKLQQCFKPILLQKYPNQSSNFKLNINKLPQFCFPQGIRLSKQMTGFLTQTCVFTLQDGTRIYCTSLIFKESLSQSYLHKLKLKNVDRIYSEKAFCIISQYCYTDEFSDCLHHLYRISMSKHDLPFYKVAQNFADSMILPNQQGKIGISYSYGGSNILFKTNSLYPPVSEKAIYTIFKFLQIGNIINVFEAMMLERTIIFVSQSKTVLGYATQAFTSLLFPFRWQMSLIPILPSTMKDFLNAPVPIIVGVSPSMMQYTFQAEESVIVYLDKNDVIADSLPPLPDKMEKQLLKRLADYQVFDQDEVRQYLENPYNNYIFQMQEADYGHFQGYIIRDIFFQFMLTLMRNYKKFWRKASYSEPKQTSSIGFSTEPQLISDMFKAQDFLSDLGMTKVGSFGYKFTQSSIFTCFIQKRFQFPNNPELAFFDQCIQIKKNKKQANFISPVQNDKYQVAAHPQLQKEKNLYSYDRFPRILMPHNQLRQDQIMIEIDKNKSEENQEEQFFIQMINEEFAINSCLYQLPRQKLEDDLYDKIIGLLTRVNRKNFPFQEKNKIKVINWFKQIYLHQTLQIQQMFQKWSYFSSSIQFIKVSKKQYLFKYQKIQKGVILGIHQSNDFEMIINEQRKIIFNQSRSRNVQIKKKLNTFWIEIQSNLIKRFFNEKIIPKQSQLLFKFIEQSNQYTQWTIQTVIDFREWILRKQKKLKNLDE